MTSSKQRHLEIKEPVPKEPIHEVEITSFARHPPHVRQIRQSIDDIEHHVLNAGGMCVYPTHGDPNDDTGICRLVLERVKSGLFRSGVAYTAKRMNVSANIDAEPRPTEALYDAILFVPDEPPTVFTVICDKITRRKHSEALQYNQSIAKGIVAAVRKYTDEQFSVVFGLLREAELSDDVRFKKAIDRIHAKTSQLAVPLALSMFEKKFRKVLRAFLLSLAVTDCVRRTDAENSLWVLTTEQFRVLTENIDHKHVTVNTRPSCGGTVLLLEVAKRLQRSGPTMIVTKSDVLAEQARTQSVCEYVFNADQFRTEATCRKPDIVNVVADCEVTNCLEDQSRKGMTWHFIQKPLPGRTIYVCSVMGSNK
ncbi:uncharacterized protein LOC125379159 [Haliotis rufescens]|uniref:uncharacterized protein LOC125379159 n=1 Tax=Haliotis rufescens TaxID=6454 RepID=UPI00201F04BF|nr:uncharacterized protein LOC125379159 [Haliotis rufescens]